MPGILGSSLVSERQSGIVGSNRGCLRSFSDMAKELQWLSLTAATEGSDTSTRSCTPSPRQYTSNISTNECPGNVYNYTSEEFDDTHRHVPRTPMGLAVLTCSLLRFAGHVFDVLLNSGYSYTQIIRKPFVAASRTARQAAENLLRTWFNSVTADPKCARCGERVVGLLYLQNGPVHHGCLVHNVSYAEHPTNVARALRGKLLQPISRPAKRLRAF